MFKKKQEFWLSIATFLIIILWILWPAQQKNSLPNLRADSPLFPVYGEEKIINQDNRLTQFTLFFEKEENLRDLENLSFQIGTFNKTIKIHNIRLIKNSHSCVHYKRSPSINFQDLSYLEIPILSIHQCLLSQNSRGKSQYVLELETSDQVVLIGGKGLLDFSKNPIPYVNHSNNEKVWLMSRYQTISKKNITWLEQLKWPRLRLIAYVWGADNWQDVIWVSLGIAIGAGTLSLSVWLYLQIYNRKIHLKKISYVVVIVFWSSSLLTSILAPPFQAPDEADHFRTILVITHQTDRDAKALKMIQRGHYNRLICSSTEKLTVENVNSPINDDWPEHAGAYNNSIRSIIPGIYWKNFLKYFLETPLKTEFLIWLFRFLNGLIVSVSILITFWLLEKNSDNDGDKESNYHTMSDYQTNILISAITLTSIPTLSHFANHISNYVFLVAGFIVLSMSSLLIISGNNIRFHLMLWISSMTTITFFSGRTGIFAWFITLMLFSIRWLSLHADKFSWMGVCKETLYAIIIFLPSVFLTKYFYFHPYIKDQPILSTLGKSINLFGLVITIFLVLPFVISLFGKVFFRFGKTWFNQSYQLIFSVKNITLFYVIYLFSFLVIKGTPIPNIEYTEPISRIKYIGMVLQSFILNSAIGGNDFLLIQSFWGGFACPINVLKWFPMWVITCFLLGGYFFGFANDSKKLKSIVKIRFFLFSFVCIFYLICLSYTAHLKSVSIQGRYLIGFYLLFITGSVWGWFNLLRLKFPKHIDKYALFLYSLALLFNGLGILSLIVQFY